VDRERVETRVTFVWIVGHCACLMLSGGMMMSLVYQAGVRGRQGVATEPE
jgi:hypothetical protein